jgi:RNA polymerase sigma-70 factor (ECF subfamily)
VVSWTSTCASTTELRRIAGYCMQNERPGRTLQTTALVNEAYLRLIDVNNVGWEHRVHFFAVSAPIMRRILVDGARERATAKRGGGIPRVNLDEIADVSSGRDNELIALDEALESLAQLARISHQLSSKKPLTLA